MTTLEDVGIGFKCKTCRAVGAVEVVPSVDNLAARKDLMDKLNNEMEELRIGPTDCFKDIPINLSRWRPVISGVDILMNGVIS